MKALTAKSRRALLVFLSALTLALVISVTLPARIYVHRLDRQKIVSQVMAKKVAKKLVRSTAIAGQPTILTSNLPVESFRPWTAVANPRAPPA